MGLSARSQSRRFRATIFAFSRMAKGATSGPNHQVRFPPSSGGACLGRQRDMGFLEFWHHHEMIIMMVRRLNHPQLLRSWHTACSSLVTEADTELRSNMK